MGTIILNFIMKYWIYFLVVILGGLLYISHVQTLKERAAKDIAQSNYVAVDQGTKTFTTKLGNLAATVNALQLSNEQLATSNNKRIQDLVNVNTDMGNKLNKSNTLISALGTRLDSMKVKVVHDTTIGKVKYKDYEKYSDKNLYLERFLLANSDTAKYSYLYHNNLYAAISSFKVGVWKFKNLFTPRKIDYKLTISSDDKKYKLDSLILIRK